MAWQVAGNIRGPQGAAGPQGAVGVAGAAGPAGLTWRGAWVANNAYAIDDSVSRNGATWFAPVAIAAGNDPNPSADGHTAANGWALLAAEGAPGPQGPVGADGAQGPVGAGPQGAVGARGTNWYTGSGAPVAGNTVGSVAGDKYLDLDSGDVYTLA